jgi:hypothetical protein
MSKEQRGRVNSKSPLDRYYSLGGEETFDFDFPTVRRRKVQSRRLQVLSRGFELERVSRYRSEARMVQVRNPGGSRETSHHQRWRDILIEARRSPFWTGCIHAVLRYAVVRNCNGKPRLQLPNLQLPLYICIYERCLATCDRINVMVGTTLKRPLVVSVPVGGFRLH